MKKYIFPGHENTRKNKDDKANWMNHLLNLWWYLEFGIDDVNHLVDDNQQTTSTIERRKRQEIKYSETERNHRHERDNTSELNTMISKSNEDTTNSYWSSDAICRFFFLLFCGCIRKTRRQYRAKSTEWKSYLLDYFSHTITERSPKWELVIDRCYMREDIRAHFTILWSENDMNNFFSSLYTKCMTRKLRRFEQLRNISWHFHQSAINSDNYITFFESCFLGDTAWKWIYEDTRKSRHNTWSLSVEEGIIDRDEFRPCANSWQEWVRWELTNMDSERFCTSIK